MPHAAAWCRGLSMKNRFAPFGAILSVLAFLAWVSSSARNDPSVFEVEGELGAAVSRPPEAVPLLRERTSGSAVPCAVPLAWRIARVDESFGLSRAEARAALNRAVRLWEEAVGPGLFSNESDGGLAIRFVYDDRQEARRQIRRLELEYNEASASLEARGEGLNEMSQRNRGIRRQNQVALRDLDRRVTSLNDSIRDWNAQGGAPVDVGERLRTSASLLEAEREELTAREREIDEREQQLTEEFERLDREVEAHRREAEALVAASPGGRRDSGTYRELVNVQDGAVTSVTREIRIYQFDGLDDLILLAAHELGHALGLAHNAVPGGIMRAEFSQTALLEGLPRVQPGDVEALRLLCPEL